VTSENSVVLPAPLSPSSAVKEPAGTVRRTSSRTAALVAALDVAPQPPLVGFVWRDPLGGSKDAALQGFFAAVHEANRILRDSDAAWERLRPVMQAANDTEFERLRDYFRAGIPGSWDEAETRAAERLFAILADIGGPALVGPRARFDPALFRSFRN
jgi:NitT/TauT family transport system substrate-binding protein